ncbi:NADH-quinone oxidoreductase subunit J family protein [Sediminibacterium soli]|uniref:NADH-quinone oxidoreductase subunit J family protein n=1 Tax=Sediminibacterium soli TaxID=2698829 RepID=UPI00137B5B78|nr:NADH-quinone oxidoreductase subunit J [Sediminibacterium soli]NCI47203.1 NADH-quinone oxidoreductase subunit J [Sediminibacterium soli]
MNISVILFYVIAVCILGAGLLAVTARQLFRSAIWLLFSLVGIAALYFWMQVEFIAAVQIIVYVGGIVVLIIFSIFLTEQSGAKMPSPPIKRKLPALLAVLFGILFTARLISQYFTSAADDHSFQASMQAIGRQMLSTTDFGFLLPFEAISFLLLAAMIGCIVIAMKPSQADIVSPQNAGE